MIKIENLHFSYIDNKPIINGLSLHVEQFTTTAIIGASGCGKSTLLLLLAGLLKTPEHSIFINNQHLSKPQLKTSIVFQDSSLFYWKNVNDNLKLAMINQKISKQSMNTKIDDMLNNLDIIELKETYIHELSGGQKQRVAIACALLKESELLLLDEPSASLDAQTKENFQDLLKEIKSEYQLTIVLITHDIEEAVFLADNIYIMKSGKISNTHHIASTFSRDSLPFYEQCIKIRKDFK